jgi:hypothetical protein
MRVSRNGFAVLWLALVETFTYGSLNCPDRCFVALSPWGEAALFVEPRDASDMFLSMSIASDKVIRMINRIVLRVCLIKTTSFAVPCVLWAFLCNDVDLLPFFLSCMLVGFRVQCALDGCLGVIGCCRFCSRLSAPLSLELLILLSYF